MRQNLVGICHLDSIPLGWAWEVFSILVWLCRFDRALHDESYVGTLTGWGNILDVLVGHPPTLRIHTAGKIAAI